MAVLTGTNLRLFRLARTIGLIRLYGWFQMRLLGRCGYHIPWFDPFDAGHLCMAIAPRVAAHGEDCFTICASEFGQWVDADTRAITGYDPRYCFDRLCREARRAGGRTGVVSGLAAVSFVVQPEHDGTLTVFVLDRLREERALTNGQHHHVQQAMLRASYVDKALFARLRAEARSRDWPHPAELYLDDDSKSPDRLPPK